VPSTTVPYPWLSNRVVNMLARTATCACEQLRVTYVSDPMKISLWHCLECQKRTGSTLGVAAFFPRENNEAKRAVRTYRQSSDSGFAVNFRFCPHCGSTVFWQLERRPDAVAVAVVRSPTRFPYAVAVGLQRTPFRITCKLSHLRCLPGSY
jgi:hypothetical protein